MSKCMYAFDFRYKMPLLHTVGVTPIKQTVSLSLCFLSEESEPDYTWALALFRNSYSAMIDERKVVMVVDQELALISGINTPFRMLHS